jgi:hypothetical protein
VMEEWLLFIGVRGCPPTKNESQLIHPAPAPPQSGLVQPGAATATGSPSLSLGRSGHQSFLTSQHQHQHKQTKDKMNKPGHSKTLEYLTWDRTPRTAHLQVVGFGSIFGVPNTSDPDWHVSSSPDLQPIIAYLTIDGSQWAAKAHSHTNPLTAQVDFTFEHYRSFDLNNAHHESDGIGFLAPDGTKWLARVVGFTAKPAPITNPPTPSQSYQPIFNLEQLP